MQDLFNYKNLPTFLQVRVTPKAKSSRIQKTLTPEGTDLYKVYVTAPPENGKANEAVLALLAKVLDLPKSDLTIIHGLMHRDKVIAIKRQEP